MKKFIAAVMSLMLAVTACAFSACESDENIGVVEGNYVETDAAGLAEAVKSVDGGLVDETAQGFGFDLSTKTSLALSVPDGVDMTASLDFGYKFNADLSGDALALLGSGNGKLNYSLKSGNVEETGSYGADILNDSAYIYLNLNGDENTKCKINVAKLIEESMQGALPDLGGSSLPDGGLLPDLGETGLPDESLTPDLSQISLPEIIAEMEELGIKSYVDTSAGLKIKISFTAEAVKKALTEIVNVISVELPEETAAVVKSMLALVKFDTVKMDYYFAFDEDGRFVQFGEDIDIAVTVQAPALPGQTADPVTLSFKSGGYFKAYAGEVKLPAGLAEDTAYTDLTDMIINSGTQLPVIG